MRALLAESSKPSDRVRRLGQARQGEQKLLLVLPKMNYENCICYFRAFGL